MSAVDFEGVATDRRSDVALDHIAASRRQWQREHRRPRALSAGDALRCLQFEALLLLVVAEHLAQGNPLSDEDRERLALSVRRIDTIAGEAVG